MIRTNHQCHLGKPVYHNQNSSVPMLCLWQACNAICCDIFPSVTRDWQWHQLACRVVLQMLVLLTYLAASHILTYGCVHTRPPVHALHIVNSPFRAYMTSVVGIMQFAQYSTPEFRKVWYYQCMPPVVQPLICIKKGCVACRCEPRVCLIALDNLAQQGTSLHTTLPCSQKLSQRGRM